MVMRYEMKSGDFVFMCRYFLMDDQLIANIACYICKVILIHIHFKYKISAALSTGNFFFPEISG